MPRLRPPTLITAGVSDWMTATRDFPHREEAQADNSPENRVGPGVNWPKDVPRSGDIWAD
jgi:hypothetical protein